MEQGMEKCRVLVTGGLGSIGHILCARLIREGYEVVIVDDLSVGRKEFLENLPGVKLYECDVADNRGLEKVFGESDVGAVVHLAAKHYIPYCEEHPKETVRVNVVGTLNVLEAMRQHAVPRLVFASTSSVYKPGERPYQEDDSLEPVNVYGATKLVCEEAVKRFSPQYGVAYTILRFMNVYGPDDLVHHVIPEMVKQARSSDVIKVGNTESKRDFIKSEDIADAIVRCLENDVARNNVYNVGTGKALSVKEVFDALCKAANRKLVLEVDETRKRKVDPPVLHADISKIMRELGWQPGKEFSLEETFAKTRFWPA
ncbi:hypothetical protein A2110_02995 [Candidatus Jorgensenbacteria bacterium GWA1_54_12]|uniref:NAD-dependent epimerase/dehydratase domain-containing protein n=1 Tax=Candidatus Jorgensenbacteria bacterium GWA1_54_12 TaxID=1798468 RepID=A0A1F6BKS8_9BACT|nr:MAG: hypothetical protein A2110_02995 [Candidatus Jorgensenbacteria bacterium GWA1_54_12]